MDQIETLTIEWPTSDTRQVFHAVDVDQALELREGVDALVKTPLRPFAFAR